MSITQFLPFGTGLGANTLPYATYSALTTLIAQGFQTGVAESDQFNTLMRQVSVAGASLAKFVANNQGSDVLDDGSLFDVLLLEAVKNAAAASAANLPVGAIQGFIRPSAPPGWLVLFGQPVSRTLYASLFGLWGVTFGPGDGSTTFDVPDFRGVFLRGMDVGRGLDPNGGTRTYGDQQDWATGLPRGNTTTPPAGLDYTGGVKSLTGGASAPNRAGFARVSKPGEAVTVSAGTDATTSEVDLLNVVSGDDETRPVNRSVLWCVKY